MKWDATPHHGKALRHLLSFFPRAASGRELYWVNLQERPEIRDDETIPPAAPDSPAVLLRADLPAADGSLRRLVVEERVGRQRDRELARVPLFFHEGECIDPHGLQIHAVGDQELKTPIAYQPDDMRQPRAGGAVVGSPISMAMLVQKPHPADRFIVPFHATPPPGTRSRPVMKRIRQGRSLFAPARKSISLDPTPPRLSRCRKDVPPDCNHLTSGTPVAQVNAPQTEAELARLRQSVTRGVPFGSES